MAENLQTMKPRDVVTPSATILGLIVTALGILVALAGESRQIIVRNFAFLFIVVVILFILAVIFTALSSLLRKARLWSAALVVYVAGWIVLGSVLIIVLVGYAYGLEVLQVQLPEFDFRLILSSLAAIAGISSAILTRLFYEKMSAYRKKVHALSDRVVTSKKDFDEATAKLSSESFDLTNSLVILRSDIERELRKLIRLSKTEMTRHYPYPIRRLVTALKQREIISPDLAYSILFVYNSCSRAVHGEEISKKDALLVRELGIKILVSLRNLAAKYERQ